MASDWVYQYRSWLPGRPPTGRIVGPEEPCDAVIPALLPGRQLPRRSGCGRQIHLLVLVSAIRRGGHDAIWNTADVELPRTSNNHVAQGSIKATRCVLPTTECPG